MKIVLAPDKFKGSLTGFEFCDIVAEALYTVHPTAKILKLPLSDGGDGTVDILAYHLRGKKIEIEVKGPLFTPVKASYLYMASVATAYIEMAEASGLKLLAKEVQNCMLTTTYGTGQLILDAIKKGAKTIVLGIGGSATTDCGIGMAAALGYEFLGENRQKVIPIGKNLGNIKTIATSPITKQLQQVAFKVACDVDNPLYGTEGAAFVYGAQKGASQHEIKILDKGLKNMADLFLNQFHINTQYIKGAGAAGGLGAGASVFLNAQLFSGIELVKNLIGFDTKITGADWIITGEGKLDNQTFLGKTISGVVTSANKQHIPVAALCGSIAVQDKMIKSSGISYGTAILDRAESIEDAMRNSGGYLFAIALDFAKKLRQ